MKNVLIVDDEPEVCQLLSGNIRRLGLNVAHALSIKSALAKMDNCYYDLIFIDLNLGGGSGYDLLNAVKGRGLNSKIVVISAYDSESTKAVEKGADYFVAKPFTGKQISSVLGMLGILN